MVITDPAIVTFLQPYESWLHYVAPAIGALIVLAWGKWHASRRAVHEAVEEVEEDIAEEEAQQEAGQSTSTRSKQAGQAGI